MNLMWIIPKSGKPQARNIHARDRTQLERDRYSLYRLEWTPDSGATREASVYAQRAPTLKEINAGADALFGAMGGGTVRLLDQAGKVVLP